MPIDFIAKQFILLCFVVHDDVIVEESQVS